MNASELDPNGLNLAFVEGMYEDFLADPASVSQEWAIYFESFNGEGALKLGPTFRPSSLFNPPGADGHQEDRPEVDQPIDVDAFALADMHDIGRQCDHGFFNRSTP